MNNYYGLYDMAGNVREWTADWYQAHHQDKASKPCCIPLNPEGATKEQSVDPTYHHQCSKGTIHR